MSFPRALILSVAVLGTTSSAIAQGPVTVQQPVVERFSADTVVSVPDRGRLLLGGVSSAGATRKEFGPLPWGTATGRYATHSGLDVGVFIHDFEAMDEALLSQPVRSIDRQPQFQSSRAAAAWRHLRKQ